MVPTLHRAKRVNATMRDRGWDMLDRINPVPEKTVVLGRLRVTVYQSWTVAEAVWPSDDDPAFAATVFQGRAWLAAWYATVGSKPGIEPLILDLREATTDRPLLFFPLIVLREGRRRVVTFADHGLSDYNGPVIARTGILPSTKELWAAIRSALPPADIVRLEKMPLAIDGVRNPLADIAGVRPSRLQGNVITIDGTWEAYLKSLERTFRKELGRSLRVFERHEGARFERIVDADRARYIIAQLEKLQSERIRDLGLIYTLDEADSAALYRRLVEDNIAQGRAILTALTVGDEVVAALLAIADKSRYAMVRLGTAGGAWRTASPGRLVIERTMHTLYTEGRRSFDFTTGDYAYKRRLGVKPVELVELTKMLSLAGTVQTLVARTKGTLRRYPRLKALVSQTRTHRPD